MCEVRPHGRDIVAAALPLDKALGLPCPEPCLRHRSRVSLVGRADQGEAQGGVLRPHHARRLDELRHALVPQHPRDQRYPDRLSLLFTPSGAETLVFWVSQPLAWLVAPKDVLLMTRRGDLKLSHGATAKARENAVKQDRVQTTNAIKSP